MNIKPNVVNLHFIDFCNYKCAYCFVKKENLPNPCGSERFLEQDTGVEPAFTAWEAVVLPIYESCVLVAL